MAGHTTILIRRAKTVDVEVLVDFSAAMARETEGRELDRPQLRKGTQAVFDSPARGFYLVAEAQGLAGRRVVGQLMITFEWSDWRCANFWWIQSVYVDPAWRRQGVYRRLHQAVVEQAKARTDVCGLRLYVEGANENAKRVYERVGMSRSVYQVFEDDFILSRHKSGGR